MAVKYIEKHSVPYPPFFIFVDFMGKLSRTKNNPSFIYEPQTSEHVRKDFSSNNQHEKFGISALKTQFVGMSLEKPSSDPTTKCPVHNLNYALNKCKASRFKSLEARQILFKENRISFAVAHLQHSSAVIVKCLLSVRMWKRQAPDRPSPRFQTINRDTMLYPAFRDRSLS